jgi:hypothetical protein
MQKDTTFSIRSIVNIFVDWPHSGAVMCYSSYVETQDGALSIFSHPGKKQLRACDVFGKKVTVVDSSYCQAVEIENVAV